jgi:pseudouridine-5'-phosphate glycosidase
MTLFWLSFADTSRAPGTQLLGVAIVPGADFEDAVAQAWQIGCNPGGQVVGLPIPDTFTIAESNVGRLLTRAEAEVLDADLKQQKRLRDN